MMINGYYSSTMLSGKSVRAVGRVKASAQFSRAPTVVMARAKSTSSGSMGGGVDPSSSSIRGPRELVAGSSRIYAPRNDKQRKYIELLEMERPCIVIGHGTAGTGKTKLAVEVGVQKLINKEVERMIVTRPAVAVDEEQHGFLPGTLEQKMKPWLSPVLDTLSGHFSSLQIERMIETRMLEIAPLTYMRGRTFENCWIVVDEAQNMTKSQMLMMLTRMGKGSKLVFTGDPCQHDRRYNRESGLIHFLELLEYEDLQHPDIRVVEFTDTDVERHHMIPHILRMYNDGPLMPNHDIVSLASGRNSAHHLD